MNRAILIDPYSKGCYHEVINISYLIMIMKSYDNIIYIADRTACANVKKQLDNLNIRHCQITFISKRIPKVPILKDGYAYVVQMILIGLFDWFYSIKYKNDDIFYNGNVFYGIFLLNYLPFGTHNRLFILCHSELENIQKDRRSPIEKFQGSFWRFIFGKCSLSKRFHFILLGDRMCEYFKKQINVNNQNLVYSIDHPYIRCQYQESYRGDCKVYEFSDYVKIGIPSLVSPTRGLHNFNAIIKNLNNKNVHLFFISRVVGDLIKSPQVSILSTDSLSSYSVYSENLIPMDYLLYLYDYGSYKMTASGAVLEAIWRRKPILALKNSYFDYLFEKYGAFGCLCDTIEEIIDLINNGLDKIKYNLFVENIETIRTHLLPENVAEDFKNIIDK